ncbi:MAG: GDP-mannose 4,6-dehydratase [Pseudoxanthomonas sp.]
MIPGAVGTAGGTLLLTGANGFVGRHVERSLRNGGFSGMALATTPAGWDIRDAAAVRRLVDEVRPTAVLHLAAQSFVPRSFEDPRETLDINLIGTLNLLQSLSGCGFAGRLVYVSSGDVYGRVPEEALPVDESRTPEPRSPYAVSKLAAEQLCLQWGRTEGLQAIIARPFNHVGADQDPRFVLPALARQVALIEAGRQAPVIEAGDIDTTRDFTDVRDIVAAYDAMFRAGQAGRIYLVASGIERRVRDLLTDMCRLAGIEPRIHQDPAKLRPAEQRRMVADAALLTQDTGWRPQLPFETTLSDILDTARKAI